jgi:hypothetical protein
MNFLTCKFLHSPVYSYLINLNIFLRIFFPSICSISLISIWFKSSYERDYEEYSLWDWLSILFGPENGSDMLLRQVGLSPNYTALQPVRPYVSEFHLSSFYLLRTPVSYFTVFLTIERKPNYTTRRKKTPIWRQEEERHLTTRFIWLWNASCSITIRGLLLLKTISSASLSTAARPDLRGERLGRSPPGPPQNINRIHRFYIEIFASL